MASQGPRQSKGGRIRVWAQSFFAQFGTKAGWSRPHKALTYIIIVALLIGLVFALVFRPVGVRVEERTIEGPTKTITTTVTDPALVASNATLSTENAALKAENAALKARVMTTTTTTTTVTDPALVASNAALSAEIAALKAENTALKTSNATLSAENAALRAENTALKASNAALSAENAALRAENNTLKASNATLSAEIAALKAENAALRQQIAGFPIQPGPMPKSWSSFTGDEAMKLALSTFGNIRIKVWFSEGSVPLLAEAATLLSQKPRDLTLLAWVGNTQQARNWPIGLASPNAGDWPTEVFLAKDSAGVVKYYYIAQITGEVKPVDSAWTASNNIYWLFIETPAYRK